MCTSIQKRRKLEEREITAEIRRYSAKEKETYERHKKKMSELKEDSRILYALKVLSAAIRLWERDYRLIRSGIINWRPGKFVFLNFKDIISRDEHKIIYSGLILFGPTVL